MNLIVEETQELSRLNDKILPIIKSRKWLKSAKELVMKHPKRSPIIAKALGTTDFVTVYVVYDHSSKVSKYINQNDLRIWKLEEKDVHYIALKNLRSIFQKQKGEFKFRETQTGIFYFNKLGNFSASVILLSDAISLIEIPEKDKVYQVVKSDLLLVANSTDAMAACVMGDVSLRFLGSQSYIGIQPLRYKDSWMPYEHNKVDHQFPVPLNKDEIKIYRKAIFRK